MDSTKALAAVVMTLALALHAGSDGARARTAFDEALAAGGRGALDLLGAGQTALEQKDYARAETLLAEAAGTKPRLALAHYHLGRAYEAQEKHAQALEAYQRTLKEDSHFLEVRPLLAALHERLGRIDEAWRQYALIVQVDPQHAVAKAKKDSLSASLTRQPEQLISPLVGFHPMKDDPSHQMEAHHYCEQVNEDFAQCVLFDGNDEKANLNGTQFIISEKLFLTLPAAERKYWHPHNAEILSGQLVGSNLPETAEKAFMRQKMNSYGKTGPRQEDEDRHHGKAREPPGPGASGQAAGRGGRAQGEVRAPDAGDPGRQTALRPQKRENGRCPIS